MTTTVDPVYRDWRTGEEITLRFDLTLIDARSGAGIAHAGGAEETNHRALECPDCWTLVRESRFVAHTKAMHPADPDDVPYWLTRLVRSLKEN